MAFQIPGGPLIVVPRRGHSFTLPATGSIEHPEVNLLAWKDQGILASMGITEVPDPVIGDAVFVDFNTEQQHYRNKVKSDYRDYLSQLFDSLEENMITAAYARGDAALRAIIGEVWDWRSTVIADLRVKMQAINQATDIPGLHAITWDPATDFEPTRPSYTLWQLLGV